MVEDQKMIEMMIDCLDGMVDCWFLKTQFQLKLSREREREREKELKIISSIISFKKVKKLDGLFFKKISLRNKRDFEVDDVWDEGWDDGWLVWDEEWEFVDDGWRKMNFGQRENKRGETEDIVEEFIDGEWFDFFDWDDDWMLLFWYCVDDFFVNFQGLLWINPIMWDSIYY